jgi:hypothetical protein
MMTPMYFTQTTRTKAHSNKEAMPITSPALVGEAPLKLKASLQRIERAGSNISKDNAQRSEREDWPARGGACFIGEHLHRS